jgi:carbon-monoxide dehydrogenase medium subunit
VLPAVDYVKAVDVSHALALLRQHGDAARLLAGGTDLIVDLRERRQTPALLVDISELRELSAIRAEPGALRIGAGATVAALLAEPVVRDEFPALAGACRHFADYLTRNKATIGGNLANASPGADLAVPLLALEARVVLAGGGEQTLALEEFLLGPRRVALPADGLLREVVLPRPAPAAQTYEKLGLKHGGPIAVVSSSVLLDLRDGRCARARIALGAVAPRPFRAAAAEQELEGQPLTAARAERAAQLAAEASRPIDDVRGSAAYRRAMVRALVRRGIEAAWEDATARPLSA